MDQNAQQLHRASNILHWNESPCPVYQMNVVNAWKHVQTCGHVIITREIQM